MGYSQAELQAKVALGADAIFRVAPPGAADAPPVAADYKELCLSSEVTVGFESKSISFANFCSRGEDVEINVGATGTIDLSEMQWIADDAALVIMENAARAAIDGTGSSTVYYEFLPDGVGAGKVIYRGTMIVKSWKIKAAAAGTVTVDSPTIGAGGAPEKGAQAA